jgi:hypothetical protein
MRPRIGVVAFTLLASSCAGGGPPEDIVLVSRVSHDVTPLRCTDGVSYTFGEALERPTVIGEIVELLEQQGEQQGVLCEAELADVTLRDASGLTVVATRFAVISNQTLSLLAEEFQCGDPATEFNSEFTAGALKTGEVQVVTLLFDDGARAELTREASAFVADACYEESGRWTGNAGALDGRNGSYRWVEDVLQIEVVLSDG